MTPEEFDYFWDELQTLNKHTITALHYMKHLDGTYRCLNTDSVAQSEQELDKQVAEVFKQLTDTERLPCSSRVVWEKYALKAVESMSFSASKTSDWRRRVILNNFHLTIVGVNEIGS